MLYTWLRGEFERLSSYARAGLREFGAVITLEIRRIAAAAFGHSGVASVISTNYTAARAAAQAHAHAPESDVARINLCVF